MSLRVSMWLFLNFDSQVQNGFFFIKSVISKNFLQRNENLVKFTNSQRKFSKKKRKKSVPKKKTKLFKKRNFGQVTTIVNF